MSALYRHALQKPFPVTKVKTDGINTAENEYKIYTDIILTIDIYGIIYIFENTAMESGGI